MKKHILLLLLTLLSVCLSLSKAEGQQYPVDCRVMVPPPYSGKFTDYANTPGKLRVQLLLRDLSKPELEVSLRIRLKSPMGLVIENPAGFMYANPIRLTPGVIRTLSGPELAENFDASALEARGVDILDLLMGGYLPTGPYEWEVIAYEHYRDRQVSNVGSALMMFSSNLPPMLNLPGEGSILPASQPQNVLFSWTPRHMPGTSLGLVSYTLTLYELPDGTDDPLDYVLNSGMPLRIIETTQTSYSYGPAEVPLTPGKRYAWQVRVQADAAFENQGYSTIGTFRYGTPPCEAPVNLTAEEDGGSVWFSWEAVEGAVSYTLNIDDTEHTLSKPPYLLQGAEAGHTYTYRVQTVCSGGSRSPVSATQTLVIPKDEPEEPSWYSDPDLAFENDTYYGTEETYLDAETTATEPDPFDGLFDGPITIEVPLDEPGCGEPINVLPANPSVEQLQEVLKSQKATCAGIVASYSCGNHDGTPTYSGATIPVKAGDELAMNSLLLTIVEIDGGGNGVGKIKMPIMNGAYLGLKLSGIQAVEGGCIVGGRAEIAGDVPVVFLDAKLKENLQTLAAGLELTASAGQHYAKEIAAGIDHLKDAINNLKNKKENTRKLLEATDVNGNINPAIESCVEISQIATSLQDSLQSVYCNDKIKGVNKNDLKKALDANRDFMNKLGPALAECQNTQFTPWQDKDCKGPCDNFLAYTVDAKCREMLEKVFPKKKSDLYDYDKANLITYPSGLFKNLPTDDLKLYNNSCGEYLPIIKLEINQYSRSDFGGMNLYKIIPPKNKTAFSSCFQSELEMTQYLVIRTLQNSCANGVINCNGKNYYLDDKFISSMMKVSDFINSSESITGMSGTAWQITKEKYLTRLFEGTSQEKNDVLSYIDKHKTGVSLRGALTFLAAIMMPMEPEAVLGQRVLSYLGKVIPSGTVKVGSRIPKFFGGVSNTGKVIRTLDEIVPNGTIPPNSQTNNLFHKWFDDLLPEELDLVLANKKLKDALEDRIRWPKGEHEWCMVCEIKTFKNWKIPMSEIHRFRTKTKDLIGVNPINGQKLIHGSTSSGTFHNELRTMIQQSNSLADFNGRLSLLVKRWQIDPSLLPPLIK